MTENTDPRPEPLDLASRDRVAARREELLRLFPEVATEGGRIDFERLKLALGEQVDVGRERYGLNWPGKAEAFRATQRPSLATLRPCPEESVDFDTTQNLIIEGDNLEVLKLLEKSYLGKVKMIYIDPPYNTGNDFIYPDNYAESLQTYLEYTGQVDSERRRFGTNTEAEGRFHSRWLSMMYPRLVIARNLLREDGVIMVSIDDNEMRNILCVMDEVFGEANRCGVFVWEKKRKPSFLSAQMGSVTEYVVAYARARDHAGAFVHGKVEDGKMYPFNNAGNAVTTLVFPANSVRFGFEVGSFEPQDMSKDNIRAELLDPVSVRGWRNEGAFRMRGEWRYSQERLDAFCAAGEEIVIRRAPFRPNYVNRSDRDKKMSNLFTAKGMGCATYEDATEEMRELFGLDVMEYPKPEGLIRILLGAVLQPGDLALDFFAGSGTTAAAVMGLNDGDQGARRFILIQLPEPTRTRREDGSYLDSEAWRAGYSTIAEITKERVRRVIGKMKSQALGALGAEEECSAATGFRVFKLDASGFKPWQAGQSKDAPGLQRQIEDDLDNVLPDRTELDLLYEILLKDGLELTTPIQVLDLCGFRVHSIGEGTLLLCLQEELSLDLVRAMADLKPQRVVCLDRGFAGNDQLKVNAAKIFQTCGVEKFKTV
ncbi:MAG: site-specific DNA-methyltransferase [Planctomycetes bacterium]|nr:site-specific DNA-methyltransferase [Planctomycetota bacterium]